MIENTAQRQLHPIVKMLKWMKYSDLNDFDEVCDVIRQPNQPTVNDSNNNSQDAVNENDDTEIDSISLEILWQPQNDTKIIADVVFIHGLHGMAVYTHFTIAPLSLSLSCLSHVSPELCLIYYFH